MIEAMCIDDSNRPEPIKLSKWVKKGEKYHIIFAIVCLPQNTLAFSLSEIELTHDELPFEYFSAHRFGFQPQDLLKLLELIKDCNETQFDMKELMKQTELIQVENG